jgi:hypothetical protein
LNQMMMWRWKIIICVPKKNKKKFPQSHFDRDASLNDWNSRQSQLSILEGFRRDNSCLLSFHAFFFPAPRKTTIGNFFSGCFLLYSLELCLDIASN